MRSMSRRATGPSAALPDAPETPRGGPLESGRLEPLVYEEELAPPPNDVLVHIDKSDFALTVFVNGAPRHRFPVGLGLLDATPTGEFNIGNKIADPDWHSGSEVVKAGDPRNPLGAFWMGLSDGRGSTSYGLHPTGDPHSIGRLSSRGCIRMRPSDAQTLYRMCPIGTPVRICR